MVTRLDRLTDGDLEVEVIPTIGARLHRIRAFGHEVLRTPPDPAIHAADPFFWGGYVMAPWCNRVEARPMEVEGRRIALRSNFPDGTAIHGQVYAAPWTDDGPGAYTIQAGGDGWPWTCEVSVRYTVAGTSLTVELRVTNTSDGPMPAGIGFHPWFVGPLETAIHAAEVFPSNLTPGPSPEPVFGRFDLRRPRRPAGGLDACWVELADPAVEVRWPGTDLTMTMRTGRTVRAIVAASPTAIDAVAIEPETHAPGAIRRLLRGWPLGPEVLAPGDPLELCVELAFDRSPVA